MEVSFVKFSPTQNVTVLVESKVPRRDQAALAAKLLAYDNVGGEQVGFLEEATLPGARMRLQMMGGEFCGNAAMSLGAYLAWKDDLPDGGATDCLLEVSGVEEPVLCGVRREKDAYRGTVQMPLPERFGEFILPSDRGTVTLPAVALPGITHLIAGSETGLTRAEIERRIREWNAVVRADALGVLRCGEPGENMEPVVYVPASGTVVWERGCGSGTAALGCRKAQLLNRSCSAMIRQPGGEIGVDVRVEAGRITGLTITGTVRLTARGIAYV